MADRLNLAASLQAKNGRLYAVIQAQQYGKKNPVWRTIGLPEGTNKAVAGKAFRKTVRKYEEKLMQEIELANRLSDEHPVFDYVSAYYEKTKSKIQKSTADSYHKMIHGKIQRYFTAHPELTIESLRARDIEDFYDWLYEDGCTPSTVIHYHAILHRAFRQAFKDDLINVNPFDKIDRPRKNKFQGDHYSEEELVTLLNLSKDDVIFPAIMLAGGLGLRRSEALGVRWSRIDWDKRTVLLDTKVINYYEDGKTIVLPQEEMKNKTSRRTLPLPDPVYDMLKEQQEKQAIYQDMFKSGYCRKYKDYVCTDPLGKLLAPNYVTNRFRKLLQEYGLRPIRYHDLRHTFASILLGEDVPLINVSNFLGHSDISTTANIYAHLDKKSKQRSADVISEVFQKMKK